MNSPFALLRLASPQLPIGGYSYSQGLELAIDSGVIRSAVEAETWLRDNLELNLARFEAPLLLAHCEAAAAGDWPRLGELAERHRASRETAEFQLESRQTGYSLAQLLLGLPELDGASRRLLGELAPTFALGWALAARAWAIAPRAALDAWLWTWLENQLAVLMKTLPLGQQAAQRLTSLLLPTLTAVAEQAATLPEATWGGAPFGLALSSMAHERQYSRLFRS
ncbi:urease accessory UreF family protein [Pseudomonas sp. 102515]|uniref:urease accessory protein UreF n=1 Tax=Pseudomonas sp. 102515 TaxID=3071568 RepID=UPI0028011927|nr:urease accessory UreF family protein [Pseudomonas sp. 102515]MDQ7915764.1 urease accessory UreF family protein [Pseudomonas sp. 102515]